MQANGAHSKGFNGHTKWIVAVVSVAIVTALGTLIGSDRAELHRKGNLAVQHQTDIAVMKVQVEQTHEMVEDIQRILREQERERRSD